MLHCGKRNRACTRAVLAKPMAIGKNSSKSKLGRVLVSDNETARMQSVLAKQRAAFTGAMR